MSLIPNHYLKAVVSIGVPGANKTHWVGTGFLYGHTVQRNPDPKLEIYRIFVVTNKHVFANRSIVVLRFENDRGGVNEFTVPLVNNGNSLWFGHTDQHVDVAILPIDGNVLHHHIGLLSIFKDYENGLPLSHSAAANLEEGDGIFLLGFPMGLVDSQLNLPIVRGGTLARIKDCKAGRSKSFLVDCQTFPGNSGGPVLNKVETMSIAGTNSLTVCYLIGVVAAYLPYRDEAVSRQTGLTKIVFEENSGLSVVYPVDTIIQTIIAFLQTQSSVKDVMPSPATPK